MEKKVFDYINKNIMINSDDVIVMGVSGGADSMCLLFLLKKFNMDVRVVHVHHGLRGKDADNDEVFVREYCIKNDIPYKLEKRDIGAISRETHETCEEAGRRVRYEIFNEFADSIAKSEQKRVYIATGHHQNDQAETVIFNLFRGSGIKGISGMRPVEGRIIRPLLAVTKNEIQEYAIKNDIKYVTDATNEYVEYSRNLIRHKIMTKALSVNSRAIENICNASNHLRAIDDYIRRISMSTYDEYVREIPEGISLDIKIFDIEDRVIYSEVIRLCIKNIAGRLKDITNNHIEAVIELSRNQTGKKIDLPYGVKVNKGYEWILFQHSRTEKKEVSVNKSLEIIQVTSLSEYETYPNAVYTKWFDYDKINSDAVWRHRMAKDVISIKGGTQKLQDFFTKNKIPSDIRDDIWLLADGNDIIWVVGYRIGEKYKISDETKRILRASVDFGDEND